MSRETSPRKGEVFRAEATMKSIDHSFYTSREWEMVRRQYLQKVNGLCERCKAKGLYEPAKIVHHKIYLSKENYKDPSIALNFDNLEALCQDCHNKEHFEDGDEQRRYSIDSEGRLIF